MVGRRKDSEAEVRYRQMVGRRIDEVRKLRGISMEEVGRKMNPPRTKSQIHRWIQGEQSIDHFTGRSLAKALMVSDIYLFSGHGTPKEVTNPSEVVSNEGIPVQVLRVDGGRSERQRFVPGGTRGSDKAFAVMDVSMMPAFAPGDEIVYRSDINPRHGDFVWVWDEDERIARLRQYAVIEKGKGFADTRAELRALDQSMPPEPLGDHHVVLGVAWRRIQEFAAARDREPEFDPRPLPDAFGRDRSESQ